MGSKIGADFPLLNSAYKTCHLDWWVAGFRAEPISTGPRETRLPALQSLQVPVAGANMLEKPEERHLDRRKRDKPNAPFVLLFTTHPGPRRRKPRCTGETDISSHAGGICIDIYGVSYTSSSSRIATIVLVTCH